MILTFKKVAHIHKDKIFGYYKQLRIVGFLPDVVDRI